MSASASATPSLCFAFSRFAGRLIRPMHIPRWRPPRRARCSQTRTPGSHDSGVFVSDSKSTLTQGGREALNARTNLVFRQ